MVLGLSLVLGLIGGACAGAYQEFRERFFRTGDDVRRALNINFLGYLPITGNRLAKTKAKAGDAWNPAQRPAADAVTPRILRVAINAPSSSFAETLRNVKLASDVVLQRSPCKVIGFVSVLPHEGKTTVAANFAGLLAANGVRTLLIDADLRNPGLEPQPVAGAGEGAGRGDRRRPSLAERLHGRQEDQARHHSGGGPRPSLAHQRTAFPDPACATSLRKRANPSTTSSWTCRLWAR